MASPHRVAATLLGPALVIALLSSCTGSGMPQAEGTGHQAPAEGQQAKPRADPPPATPTNPVVLALDRPRQSPGVVAAGGGDAPYNYAPSVLAEGGRFRTWWCSQLGFAEPGGDDILYAESGSLDGPFGNPDGMQGRPVLSGSVTGFDAMHTCDPSVLRVAQTYYMYYTGIASDHEHANAIGVATSTDGVTWTRPADGKPIVSPANDTVRENKYNAGQPSALYLDGWYYLMFTDTTGKAAGWNGAGQFVLRSANPLFGSGVESLSDKGFVPVDKTSAPRTRSVVDAFSADWMWIDALNAFAIAHSTDQGTTITFWDRGFTRNPYRQTHLPGPWREGPGLVRTAEGHAPTDALDPCGRVPLDVLRATVDGSAGAPTDLYHFGADLAGVQGCATKESAAKVLNGFAAPSPERTVDLVVGGKVVRVERRSVADKLAKRVLDQRPAILDQLPVAARVPAGAKAVRGPDGQVGLLLDGDRLWVVGAEEIAALNSSKVMAVTATQWADYERAGDLAALRR
jgi:hypothetical protein